MTTKRVRFRERQTLRSQDLQDEQAYRIAMGRRHRVGHHGWGIVHGLTLVQDMQSRVMVQPGLAVDGYGRDLLVTEPLAIDAKVIAQWPGDWNRLTLDAYLTYRWQPPPTDSGCRSHRKHNLSHERSWLRLEWGDPDCCVDPERPPDVPEAHLHFSPHDSPMIDPQQEWPVYLGRIELHQDEEGPRMDLIPMNLRYAKLVGAQIHAPWGDDHPWMLVSNEEAADRRRFAVTLPDVQGKPVDRLILDREGNAVLRGRLGLSPSGSGLPTDGDLSLMGSVWEQPIADRNTGTGLVLDVGSAAPNAAAPWQLYRTKDADTAADQIRFEILNPGQDGDPARQEWVVGQVSADAFSPLLTARADGNLIIDGELRIEGELVEGIIPADMDDRRFRDELLSRYTKGLTLAGSEVDAFYKLDIKITDATVEQVTTPSPLFNLSTTVHLANNNSGPLAGDVFISGAELELRDDTRRVVHLAKLAVPSGKNPLPPAGDTDITTVIPLNAAGVYTLIASVYTVGGSRTTLEQSTSRIVKVQA